MPPNSNLSVFLYHLNVIIQAQSTKTKIKEEYNMKTAVITRQNKIPCPAYPNAAERSYFLHRLLDGALAVAVAVGAVVALIFLLML